MNIILKKLSTNELEQLFAFGKLNKSNYIFAIDAIAPPHVWLRSITQLKQGATSYWALPYLIVEQQSNTIVGSCGFKNSPESHSVEIGYNVSLQFRRRGIASKAIKLLTEAAFTHNDNIKQVKALIVPDNIGSKKVATNTGFMFKSLIKDQDGLPLEQWLLTKAV